MEVEVLTKVFYWLALVFCEFTNYNPHHVTFIAMVSVHLIYFFPRIYFLFREIERFIYNLSATAELLKILIGWGKITVIHLNKVIDYGKCETHY